jgi:uncharacterized membrane protein
MDYRSVAELKRLITPEVPPVIAKPGSEQRLTWIDTLRGLATLLILLLHAVNLVNLFEAEPWEPLVQFNSLFSPYRMALLMLLSGMLLPQALKKELPEYTMRKIATLLHPFLVWTAIYGLTIHPEGVTYPRLWIGDSYLWFVLFLFSYYVLAIFFRYVPVLALVLASFTLSMAAPDDTKYMERYLFLMGFFFLGHYLSTSKTVLSSLTTTKVMVLALPLAVGFSVHSMMSGGINYKVEYILPTLAGIAVLIALSRLLAGTSWSQPMDFIGRHSVVFFVIHYPVTYGITALCFAAGLTSIPFVTAVALVVALCTCLVAALLRDRIWLTEYLYSVPMRNMRSHNR